MLIRGAESKCVDPVVLTRSASIFGMSPNPHTRAPRMMTPEAMPRMRVQVARRARSRRLSVLAECLVLDMAFLSFSFSLLLLAVKSIL
jgi:hypothetical protein